jgi:hypothetical protein
MGSTSGRPVGAQGRQSPPSVSRFGTKYDSVDLSTPWTSTVCYGDSFTSLHVDDVRTSRKHAYRPPRPVTGIDLLLYI